MFTSSLLSILLHPPKLWNAVMSRLVIRSITLTARVTNCSSRNSDQHFAQYPVLVWVCEWVSVSLWSWQDGEPSIPVPVARTPLLHCSLEHLHLWDHSNTADKPPLHYPQHTHTHTHTLSHSHTLTYTLTHSLDTLTHTLITWSFCCIGRRSWVEGSNAATITLTQQMRLLSRLRLAKSFNYHQICVC